MGSRVTRLAALAAIIFGCATASAQAFDAHGSARQVWVTDVPAGAQVVLTNGAGKQVATKTANSLGGTVFRDVAPGAGYEVSSGGVQSAALTVFTDASAPPSTAGYDQAIPSSGYGYLTTRDGTKLAYTVRPPLNAPTDGSPVPTLIEYAGYGYADPKAPQSGIAAIANLMGFAVVDVNMRGTGCSGGSYDFFEPLQNLDGYDVIETLARQPWVKGHKVGMFGISYGGISQLFTAATQPPSLAAIAPLSVLDQTQTTLYPGGVLNTGFAVNWAKERMNEALPSGPGAGEDYAAAQIAAGDATCKANQALHPEAVSLLKKIKANSTYTAKVADPLSPITFVNKIKVPTYLACQFTDEQTGAHCPALVNHFTGTQRKWFTFTNGAHIDSLDPATLNRMYDFLKIYVADEAPSTGSAALKAAAPIVFSTAFGISGLTLPADPVQDAPTYAAAKAAFEKIPPVRVAFDNGAGKKPGQPYAGFERSFSKFPVPGTTARAWYLSAGGGLAAAAPKKAQAASFTWNAHATPSTDFTGGTGSGKNGLWTETPPYKWSQPKKASGAAFVSPKLAKDTIVVGAGSVTAYVKSSAPRTDLQATVSEIRPDGKEVFVQSGWLRGDLSKLDAAKSTALEPVLSLRAGDRKPLSAKRFTKVTIPLYYQGHAYRKGSRLRVRISAPNGDQPIWSFGETKPSGTAKVTIGAGATMPSRLLLPVVPGSAPTALPKCPGLRGEPCRAYVATKNTVVKP